MSATLDRIDTYRNNEPGSFGRVIADWYDLAVAVIGQEAAEVGAEALIAKMDSHRDASLQEFFEEDA